jgi:Tol biopolymer transport system component
LISVDGQQRRRLTETPGPADAGVGDIMPVFSRDGRHLAFVRERSAGANSLHVLPLSVDIMPAGAPVTVSDLSPRSHVLGLAWAEHDRALIFSTSPFLATQSRLHRLALTPDRLRAADGPRVLSFGDQATNLTASESGRIVYTAHSRDSALARLDLTQPHPVPQPPGVRPSTFDEHTPAYSRDGTRIAFASTRTGTEELWVSNVDGTGLRQVTFIGGAQCANPQWSPIDDDLILFNSRQHGSSDLFVLHLSSGRYERLTSDAADDAEARWSRDGRSIYFASNRSGTLELWKMPAVGGRPVQITRGGGVAGSEGSDGFIYYAKGLPSPTSIWRVPAAGGEAAPVVEGLSYSTNFALGRRGLYLMARGESSYDTAIDYVDLASRSRKRLTSIGKRWWFGLALSPDEKSLLYSIVESSDANLMLVDKAW